VCSVVFPAVGEFSIQKGDLPRSSQNVCMIMIAKHLCLHGKGQNSTWWNRTDWFTCSNNSV